MELKLIHFYPDLMNLYGSYANLTVLQRKLEQMGNTVTVEAVLPGETHDFTNADFLFMGAGTERAQKAALHDFVQYADTVKSLADANVAQLYCGTAMDLLGKTITDAEGQAFDGIGLVDFTVTQHEKRIVEDVYGHTTLYPEAVVGFINKSSEISGVETPLLRNLRLGYGNEAALGPEGYHKNAVFASHLTGPILVKNPRLLDAVIAAIYQYRGQTLPPEIPQDHWAEAGYAITAEQLKFRSEA